MSSVHPQRCQGFDPTFAQNVILYYTPAAICQKCIVRTYLFLADNDPDTQNSRCCSISTQHLMGHGPGRPVQTFGRPHGHGECRRSSSSTTPDLLGSGPNLPVKTHGPPHEPGVAAHIEPASHGPRPGPAHQFFKRLGPVRPGPSHFQTFWPGPARPVTIFRSARPRQTAHDKPLKIPLVACVFYLVLICSCCLAQCGQLYLFLAFYLHSLSVFVFCSYPFFDFASGRRCFIVFFLCGNTYPVSSDSVSAATHFA